MLFLIRTEASNLNLLTPSVFADCEDDHVPVVDGDVSDVDNLLGVGRHGGATIFSADLEGDKQRTGSLSNIGCSVLGSDVEEEQVRVIVEVDGSQLGVKRVARIVCEVELSKGEKLDGGILRFDEILDVGKLELGARVLHKGGVAGVVVRVCSIAVASESTKSVGSLGVSWGVEVLDWHEIAVLDGGGCCGVAIKVHSFELRVVGLQGSGVDGNGSLVACVTLDILGKSEGAVGGGIGGDCVGDRMIGGGVVRVAGKDRAVVGLGFLVDFEPDGRSLGCIELEAVGVEMENVHLLLEMTVSSEDKLSVLAGGRLEDVVVSL